MMKIYIFEKRNILSVWDFLLEQLALTLSIKKPLYAQN